MLIRLCQLLLQGLFHRFLLHPEKQEFALQEDGPGWLDRCRVPDERAREFGVIQKPGLREIIDRCLDLLRPEFLFPEFVPNLPFAPGADRQEMERGSLCSECFLHPLEEGERLRGDLIPCAQTGPDQCLCPYADEKLAVRKDGSPFGAILLALNAGDFHCIRRV